MLGLANNKGSDAMRSDAMRSDAMRIAIIGADLEENLGVGMIAAAVEAAGHRVQVVPLDEDDAHGHEALARRLAAGAPELIGLSMQFQHRAGAHLRLARLLRAAGFGGHITAGGQFATAAWQRVLAPGSAVDSVVLYEGEETLVALLSALQRGAPLREVAGLALRRTRPDGGPPDGGPSDGGPPLWTATRGLVRELDRLPLPLRYRPHALHMSVPFVPVLGGRGCWGRCAFCSITSFYREGRGARGGPVLRLRSPQNVAAEMALLWARAGGRAVFCFHDDTLLLPRPEDSLRRLRELRAALDRHGVDASSVALVGKSRPDSLTPELARQLRRLGVIRLFVGVENAAQPGADHLGRGVRVEQTHRALEACRAAGIFCCYNLLIFEPQATLADIEQNIAFIRRHPHFPVNFCRAEAYAGTALHRRLAAQGRLRGGEPACDYRLEDDRAEVLFRICAAAFKERNFARRGVHNRYMGLGYSARLLEQFYPARSRRAELIEEAEQLTRAISLETAELLEEALAIARRLGPTEARRDRIERETALLGLRIAAANREQHARLDRLFDQMEAFAREQLGPSAAAARRGPRRAGLVRRAQQLARALAMAGLLGGGAAVAACDDGRPVTMDGRAPDAGDDIWPTDDAPSPDMGPDIWPTDDAPSPDMHWDAEPDTMVVDPAPDATADTMTWDSAPDATVDTMTWDSAPDVMLPPPDAMLPQDAGSPQARRERDEPLDRWRESGPRRVHRSTDLPLFDPPRPVLRAERGRGEQVLVRLACEEAGRVTTRWEGDGTIEGEGLAVVWTPQCEEDQLRVCVRSAGGVAVVSLRSREVG
jgi:radical SAM superfamily enzyme YgiQ (UPF0313 family)